MKQVEEVSNLGRVVSETGASREEVKARVKRGMRKMEGDGRCDLR